MKPRVLMICDVKGWAWWIKSHYLARYLSDEFDITIVCLNKAGEVPKRYDIYLTYGHTFIDTLSKIPRGKRITGMTAHRDINKLAPQMQKAEVIHANSILLYNQAIKIHPRVYYTPNGVDIDLFKPLPVCRKNRFVVGHVGKLSPMKGQKEIIEPVIAATKVSYFHHYNNYRTRIKHKNMPKLYSNLDVFIVASKEDGTPNPALEAMASGRPVISNYIGNMPEAIKDGVNGFLVERKASSYIEKINFLKNNLPLVREMGKKAREEIELNWSWKIMAENYRKMFNDVLSGVGK